MQNPEMWLTLDLKLSFLYFQSLNPTENEFVLQSEEVLPQDASSGFYFSNHLYGNWSKKLDRFTTKKQFSYLVKRFNFLVHQHRKNGLLNSDTKDDVTTEQIIYISYDADEKTGDGIVHILDQNLVRFY